MYTVEKSYYKSEWFDDVGGFSWKIEIYQPHANTINTEVDYNNLIEFNPESISKLIYKWDYDNFQISYPDESPNIELGINLAKTGSQFLNNMLLNPFTSINNVDFASDSLFNAYDKNPNSVGGFDYPDFNVGNIFILYTDKGTGVYERVFVGTQSEGLESKLDKDGYFETTIVDVYKQCMENIPFELMMSWLHWRYSAVEVKQYYIDYASNKSEKIAIANTSFDKYYYFSNLFAFDIHFQSVFRVYMKAYLQGGLFSDWWEWNMFNTHSKIYKQVHNDSGGLGVELSLADIYIIVAIANKDISDISDPDFEVEETIGSIIGKDYNTFFDFYKAQLESEVMNVFPRYDKYRLRAYKLDSNTTIVADIDIRNLMELEFTPQADLYERLTVSKVEQAGEDIDSYLYEENKAQNSKEYTLPLIWHGDGVVMKSASNKNWENTIKLEHDVKKVRNKSDDKHLLQMFYKDNIIDMTTQESMIKVHYYIDVAIGTAYISDYETLNAISIEDFIDFTGGDYYYLFLDNGLFKEFILKQQEQSVGNLIAQSLPEYKFKGKQSIIEAEYYGNKIIDYIFNPSDSQFQFDLSELTPYQPTLLDSYTDKYEIKSVEYHIVGDVNDMNIVKLTFTSK